MNKVLMCDPPEGWLWGFPKVVPKGIDLNKDFMQWLIKEGYPEKNIAEYGEHFHIRFWEQDEPT